MAKIYSVTAFLQRNVTPVYFRVIAEVSGTASDVLFENFGKIISVGKAAGKGNIFNVQGCPDELIGTMLQPGFGKIDNWRSANMS